jgi:hypothetical protein
VVLALALSLIVLPALPTLAGPQDDPPPPVTVVAGDGRFVSDATVSLTLTLDAAVGNGDLEPGQVEQARAAAAAEQGRTQAGADAGGSSGERAGGATAGASGGSDTAVVGECSFRAASVPAGDTRWAGNDPATGTLLVNPCNGPGQYLFVPNPAPGDPAAAAPPPPPPDPAVLAQQAYGELSLPKPESHRSPESNSDPALGGLPYTWVGLNTWVWVNNWQPLQRTVDLRGVSATVTATPTSLSFDPGNGDASMSCPGPGRPWTQADGNRAPTGGGCAYMYRSVTAAGPLTAATGITWSVAWTSNTGAGGTFPALSTTTTSSFLVEQIQVVVQR